MNLLITVRYRRPWLRGIREWWYEVQHGLSQMVFSYHPDTYEMGSNHEGIFTSRQARQRSDEIEISVFSPKHEPRPGYPQHEMAELINRITSLVREMDYEKVSVRFRNPN